MEEKESKGFGEKVEAFFAGKGFYIVLLLCIAVIGVSAWSMISGGGGEGVIEDVPVTVSGMEEDAVPVIATMPPAAQTVPPSPSAPPAEDSFDADAAEEAVAEIEETQPEAAAPPPIPEEPVAALSETAGQDYYIWPVSGEILSPYSMDMPVFNRTMQDWRTHDGLDIEAQIGEQVRAVANGQVEAVYDDERMGTTVVLRHGDEVRSVYANLAALPTVQVGDRVGVGQVIGAVGDTALYEIGEAAHLHFAMTRDGLSIDPTEYLPQY